MHDFCIFLFTYYIMAIRERFWMFFMSLYKYILGIKDEFWIYLERKKQKDMILCFFFYSETM